jgi:DNA-binding response OmpR family regulator
VRVVVICEVPGEAAQNPDSVSAILADLGCRVINAAFDLGDLDHDDLRRHPPTMLVLDAGDQLDRAVKSLRAVGAVPMLADTPRLLVVSVPRLSALDFSSGFDDFVLAPVVPAELYARMRQLDWRSATFGSDELIKVGDLVIDVAGYEAHLAGRRIDFTHQEYELLRFLAQNRVFTRDQLLQKVWGYEYTGGTRTVDIHVRRVRAKLGAHAGGLIVTVRNVGYKMRAADDD